ncbi:glycosyltransferase [Pseudoalteromonas sp. C2R02]|uniref:glycosyltransferase n=1 Tax=Pseudoalteromonas sp. C2R02 TaxID=2841565 RepID=UPI001C08D2ED|nr:glycosyltransferase [Pseudoalteromonas sp. C2R02]MBU2971753.1 glycosyltransferase [Pseudoalteromonas sp. C2R02]
MNKKIAVLVSNPCNSDARVLKMAYAARELGYEVRVFGITGLNIPAFEVLNGISFKRNEWKPVDLALNSWPLKGCTFFSMFLAKVIAVKLMPFIKYKLFSKIFIDDLIAYGPDLIHSHDFLCLPTAVKVKKALPDVKVIYDAHELEVHRNPPLPFIKKNFVRWLEKKCAKQADGIITVGNEIANILSKSFKKNVTVLYNSPVISSYIHNIREDLNLAADVRLIIYVGKVTVGRGVEDIIRLMPQLEDVFFATIGPCSEKDRKNMYKVAAMHNVQHKMRILPPVPYEKVVEYIKGADLGIISVEPVTLSYELCMPNKLFELSFADIPILANDLPELKKYIESIGNGRLMEFENKEVMASTICEMLYDKKDYLFAGNAEKASRLVEYSWTEQKVKLEKMYLNLLNINANN